jgi:hypothetical protein
MGASQWDYYVPYEPDLGAALRRLQARVFTERDYWWPYQDDTEAMLRPCPSNGAGLWSDEYVQECGTHSILDMVGIVADGEKPDFATVQDRRPAGCVERPELVAAAG